MNQVISSHFEIDNFIDFVFYFLIERLVFFELQNNLRSGTVGLFFVFVDSFDFFVDYIRIKSNFSFLAIMLTKTTDLAIMCFLTLGTTW